MTRTIEFYERKTTLAKGRLEEIEERLAEADEKVEEIKKDARALEKIQALVQKTAQETQEQLKVHIEDIVQLAIDTCFPGRYSFLLAFDIKRGKTEARLAIVDEETGSELSPMDSNGGGLVDIISFALRIAGWTLGKSANTIILDEPFRFLSKELRPRAAEILRELSMKLGIQFIVVTHTSEQIAESDRVFEVSLGPKGVSEVTVRESE